MRYLLAFILTVAAAFAQQPDVLPAENSLQETAKKDFLLSFSGVLCASNHSYLDRLEVDNMSNQFVVKHIRERLDEWWGIVDRNTFLDCVMSLVKEGHRKSYEEQAAMIKRMTPMDFTAAMQEYRDKENVMYRIYLAYNYNKMFANDMLLSWDLTRVVYLVRNAYTAGYINESEAWRILEGLELDKKMKAKYKSWEETANHYIMGRNYWSLNETKAFGSNIDITATILSEMRDSPWNVYPGIEFNGKPMPDYHQDDNKLPEVEIKIPQNTVNNPDDYPDAVIVSNVEEFLEAHKKAKIGGTIFVKSGEYKLQAPLSLRGHLKIIGQERDKVIFTGDKLRYLINMVSSQITIDSITATVSNNQRHDSNVVICVMGAGCVIRNCKIENTKFRAVVVTKEGESLIENCLFRGNDEGIVCESGHLTVKNSLVGGSQKSGIRLTGKVSVILTDNVVRNNGLFGITCYSKDTSPAIYDVKYGNNNGQKKMFLAENNKDFTINYYQESVSLLKNNIVSGNKKTGIKIEGAGTKAQTSNNICFDNKESGIFVVNSNKSLISENICYINGLSGITVVDANNIEVVGNKCCQNEQSGIYSTGFNNKLSANICAMNQNNGINFAGQGVLADNICNENSYPGILLSEKADAVLESNVTQRNMYCGIEIKDQAKAVVKKNISNNNYWAGMGIYGGEASVLLEGNTFKDNGAWGIVCLEGAAKPQPGGDVFEGNYRGNEIEVKTGKATYLSRFTKLYGK